ncbi:hypothetical protein PSACC_01676 [Paramicrosporidium saccamoebae]|uniref:Essential protein Yae1 N-terminal domain-containing protein n=1 Tax=Paramicrosporidium saccamoebae TaxID=1246581 RepID=A0A2H9TL66_9FUNG|nr:hypothetical protein PSACC_01676 [Paramicrosporidium saccamoebae]
MSYSTFLGNPPDRVANIRRKYQEEGYQEGLSAGKRRGFEEGYMLGGEEGVKLGRELGQIAGRLFQLLSQNPPENTARKISRTLQEILAVSFANQEDLEKEVRISRIRGAYKELSTILNVSMPKSVVSDKAKFDF